MMNKYLFLTFFLAYSSLAFSQRALIEKTDSLMDVLELYGAKHNSVEEQEWLVSYFIFCDEYEETDEPLYKIENDKVIPFTVSEMNALHNKWINSKKMVQAIKKYLADMKEVAVSQNHWEKHVNGTDSVMWSMIFDEGWDFREAIKRHLSKLKEMAGSQDHVEISFEDVSKYDSIYRDYLSGGPKSTLEYEYKPIDIAKKHPEFRYRIPKNTMSLWIKLHTNITPGAGLLPEVESKFVSEKRYFDYIAPIFRNKKIKVSPIEFPDNVGTLYQIKDKNLADSVLTQIKAKTKEYYRENPNEQHVYSRNVDYEDNRLVIHNVSDKNQRYCLKVGKAGNTYCIATFVGISQEPSDFNQGPSDLFSNPKYIKK